MSVDYAGLTEVWGHVYINGRLAAAREAAVSAFDRGLLYGDGVFETIRVYSGRPFMLDAHLQRMAEGCTAISLPPPDAEEIKRGVAEVLETNRLSDAYLRITVTRGPAAGPWYDLQCSSPTVLIIAKPLAPRDFGQGLQLVLSTFRSDEQSPLSRVKQTGILWKILPRAEARRAGVDDAVLLNTKGHVAEATSANIFWAHDRALYTPSLGCGILAGITRAIVIDMAHEQGISVIEGDFGLEELCAADEAFTTSSISEIVPIRSLDGKDFAVAPPGPMTKRLMASYRLRVPS